MAEHALMEHLDELKPFMTSMQYMEYCSILNTIYRLKLNPNRRQRVVRRHVIRSLSKFFQDLTQLISDTGGASAS